MNSIVRNPKDFWSGVIFVLFGALGVLIAQDYSMGSAGRMGPGYFPTILGSLLALLGMVAILRSFLGSTDEAVEKLAVKVLALVIAAVLLFAFLVRGAGLPIAVIVLVLGSAFASARFRIMPFALLALGLAVFSVLLFVKGLGLPMPVLGAWFGF